MTNDYAENISERRSLGYTVHTVHHHTTRLVPRYLRSFWGRLLNISEFKEESRERLSCRAEDIEIGKYLCGISNQKIKVNEYHVATIEEIVHQSCGDVFVKISINGEVIIRRVLPMDYVYQNGWVTVGRTNWMIGEYDVIAKLEDGNGVF